MPSYKKHEPRRYVSEFYGISSGEVLERKITDFEGKTTYRFNSWFLKAVLEAIETKDISILTERQKEFFNNYMKVIDSDTLDNPENDIYKQFDTALGEI